MTTQVKMVQFFIISLFIIFVKSQKINRGHDDVYNQCVNINEPICQGIQYTKTKMPNLAGIANQEDSAKRMNDYFPLINADCSQYFRFFLCTVYFPMCSDALGLPSVLYPCQNLCIYIQSRCEPYLRAFQLPWPNELNCTRFPKNSSMCIHPKNYELDQNKRRLDPVDIDHFKKLYPNWNTVIHPVDGNKDLNIRKKNSDVVKISPYCLPPFAPLPIHSPTLNQTHKNLCLLRCDANLLYNSSDKYLAKVWLLIWAVSGLLSSFVAIAAFLFDRKSRFKYPERPIVFIVICYGCVCVFHLIQLTIGKTKMICQPLHSNPQEFVMIQESIESPICTLMFLGTYYFEMVAAVWWMMLAVSCYLASSRKWSSEGLDSVSNLMHMVCWIIPAFKVTIILILHKIDADELLGMCYVGRHNPLSNLIFVLLPRVIYFFIGALLLIWSFRSLMLLRKNLTQPELKFFLDGFQNQQSLDKFIVKTGIFCGVYGIPIICYIGCQFYNYINTEKWNSIAQTVASSEPRCLSGLGLKWSETSCTSNLPLPLIEVRLLETFSSLVIGITSAMWMWCNKKTFVNFSEAFMKNMPCHFSKKPNPQIAIPMTNKQEYIYKNTNPRFISESSPYQLPESNFIQPQSRLPTSGHQDTLCYNQNLIMCSV